MDIKRPESKARMPDDAKKVFEGEIFDVYQWEQELYDGSTATFEKLKRPDTVITLPVLDDGTILLTKQSQPNSGTFLTTAGGRVDPGEEILTAAKRELLEETGYEAEEFVLWDASQPVSKLEWAVYIFIAKDCKKVADINPDAGEKIELVSVSFDELLEHALAGALSSDPEIEHKLLRAHVDPKLMEETRQLFKP